MRLSNIGKVRPDLSLLALVGAAVSTGLYLSASHAASRVWKVVSSVQRTPNNSLFGIGARSASNMWAVGTCLSTNAKSADAENAMILRH